MIYNSIFKKVVKFLKIKNMSEIPQAIEYIEQTFTSKHENHKGLLTNTLVCEEMLISLLKKGYSDISVSMNEARMPFVEIKFQDIQDMLEPLEYKNIDDEIETKINQNILEKYSDYINYEYKNGVKRYRIFFDKREKIPDLRDEIHNYYSTAKPEAKNKPLAILGYIAKNHRFFIAFSIFNKGLKHFAALTLPVFAVNIIEAVTDHYAFFSAPIIFNIIASITALAVNLFCAWLDNKIYHSFARGLETGFKMAIVRKFQILSIKYHSNTQAGKLLSKLVSDVQFIKQLVYENLTDVLHMCMDIVFVAVVSLIKMPVMLLFYVIAVPVASGLFRKFLIPVVASKAYLRKKTEVSNSAFKEMLAI